MYVYAHYSGSCQCGRSGDKRDESESGSLGWLFAEDQRRDVICAKAGEVISTIILQRLDYFPR